MSEREFQISVDINRHYGDDGEAHAIISTAKTELSEVEYQEDNFDVIRKTLEARKSSTATASYAAVTAAVGLFGVDQAIRAIEDSPERPAHTLLALFAVYIAKTFGEKFNKSRRDQEVIGLEAKAFQNAMRTTNESHETHFPMNLSDRFLDAIESLQDEGIHPICSEVAIRDQELRSTDKKTLPTMDHGIVFKTLDSLVEDGILIREKVENVSDGNDVNIPKYRFEYSMVEQEENLQD